MSETAEQISLCKFENLHLQTFSPAFWRDMDLNPAEQARLEALLQKKQQKDLMKMFFKVTGDCFDTCVTDFSSKALSPREVFIPRFVYNILTIPGSVCSEMY
jgi:Tim10/DDP family zinc finger